MPANATHGRVINAPRSCSICSPRSEHSHPEIRTKKLLIRFVDVQDGASQNAPPVSRQHRNGRAARGLAAWPLPPCQTGQGDILADLGAADLRASSLQVSTAVCFGPQSAPWLKTLILLPPAYTGHFRHSLSDRSRLPGRDRCSFCAYLPLPATYESSDAMHSLSFPQRIHCCKQQGVEIVGGSSITHVLS